MSLLSLNKTVLRHELLCGSTRARYWTRHHYAVVSAIPTEPGSDSRVQCVLNLGPRRSNGCYSVCYWAHSSPVLCAPVHDETSPRYAPTPRESRAGSRQSCQRTHCKWCLERVLSVCAFPTDRLALEFPLRLLCTCQAKLCIAVTILSEGKAKVLYVS